MDNCAQFKNTKTLACKDIEFKNFNNTKFDPKEFRKFIKKEFEFENSPFVYKQNEIDVPGFQLKPHQRFIGKYVNHHNKGVKGVLLYHELGSGKTLTSIVAGLCSMAYYQGRKFPKITVVTPVNLIDNYRKELESIGPSHILLKGGNVNYSPENQNKKGTFFKGNTQNKFINKQLIDKKWDVITHQGFINKLFDTKKSLPGSMIDKLKEPGRFFIFDEIHNLVSDSGENYKKLINAFKNYLHDTSKLILMSGTPIVDSSHEIGLTLNLLSPRVLFPTSKKEFDKLSTQQLKYMMAGYVSYFSGGNPDLYPKNHTRMVYHKFSLNGEQYKNYVKVFNKETRKSSQSAFFIKSIMAANIHNKASLFEDLRAQRAENKFDFYRKHISSKYADIAKQISESKGTVFVYSPFLKDGVDAIAKALMLLFGFVNKFSNRRDSKNRPKFVLWTGRTKTEDKQEFSREVLDMFNDKSNINGKNIKVILATRAVAQGVSFKNVRSMHICSEFWNGNVSKQSMGRVIRLRSHMDLPVEERNVNIYRHVTVLPSGPNKVTKELNLTLTIEEHVLNVSKQKTIENKKIESILRESAIDCSMNKYGNRSRVYKFTDISSNNKVVTTELDAVTDTLSNNIYQNTYCRIDNVEIPAKLKQTTKNSRLGRKILFETFSSKMSNLEVVKVKKMKENLIQCITKLFPAGVPKKMLPEKTNTKQIIKWFLEAGTGTVPKTKDVNVLYEKLSGSKKVETDNDIMTINNLKHFIELKKV
jgi:hypothetical protein